MITADSSFLAEQILTDGAPTVLPLPELILYLKVSTPLFLPEPSLT